MIFGTAEKRVLVNVKHFVDDVEVFLSPSEEQDVAVRGIAGGHDYTVVGHRHIVTRLVKVPEAVEVIEKEPVSGTFARRQDRTEVGRPLIELVNLAFDVDLQFRSAG